MSKIICDVCGTAYPETANQCPICGCAKAPAAQATCDDTQHEGYTYVKGGRFSKSNVKRNNRAKAQEQRVAAPAPKQENTTASSYAAPERREDRRRPEKEEPEGVNKGLVAVVIILLLAIIMVVVYIGRSVFLGGNDTTTPSDTYQQTEGMQTGSTESSVPCTELKLGSAMVELKSETEKYLLEVRRIPENTTDTLIFTSDNSSVATVDQNGLILPMGNGETVITVTCGNVSAQCLVSCTFGEPTPTEPETEPPVDIPAGFVLTLNRKDFTLGKEGETWTLYKETDGVKASDITWTTSDPAVATVENGVVKGVNKGNATITATLGEQSVTCTVRCSFNASEPTEAADYYISYKDVTLKSGESFNLTLKTKEGANVQGVEWVISDEGYVTISKNTVKANAITEKKVITISATYEGVTYTCIVRLVPDEA